MDKFNAGNDSFVAEDYEAAIKCYTEAASELSTHAPLYANRAAAYIKLKKHMQALEDCNKAVLLDSAGGAVKERALFRKGSCLFALDDFESAKAAFAAGQQLLDGDAAASCSPEARARRASEYSREVRKCDSELAHEAESAAEHKNKAGNPTPTPAPAAAAAAAPKPKPPSSDLTPAQRAVTLPLGGIKYQWYQSNEKLTVEVLARGVAREDVQVTITEEHLKVVVNAPGNPAVYEVVIDKPLYDKVVPDKCEVKVKKTRVEVHLAKEHPREWNTMEGAAPAPKKKAAAPAPAAVADSVEADASKPDPSAAVSAPAPAPSSSAAPVLPKPYASAKDWSQVNRAIEEELEAEKPEGEEAMQKLFRDIYAKATPETRRAMNKSFQTSGGTVLSTNWDEVSTKDYEKDKQAPKGVEWKNWEGKKVPHKTLD